MGIRSVGLGFEMFPTPSGTSVFFYDLELSSDMCTRPILCLCLVWILMFGVLPVTATAQTTFFAPCDTVSHGSAVTASVALASLEGIDGFQFGLCTSGAGRVGILPDGVTPGPDLSALNGGAGPDFFQGNILDDGNCTVASLVSFLVTDEIPATGNFRAVNIRYRGTGLGVVDLDFCTTGSPPVAPIAAIAGVSVTPQLVSGFVAVTTEASFVAPSGSMSLGSQATFTVTASTALSTAGFSYGLCSSDPAVLSIETSDEVTPGFDLAQINGGVGPDLFLVNVLSNGEHTVGCLYNLTQSVSIPTGVDLALTDITWEGLAVGSTDVTFCEIGSPIVDTLFVVSGTSMYPIFNGGVIEVLEPATVSAGDANGDGAIDLGDTIRLLDFLFSGGPPPAQIPCR